MFETFLIIIALVFPGLFLFAARAACEIYGWLKREVSLHAETKRRLEFVQESERFWRRMAFEKNDVLSAETIE